MARNETEVRYFALVNESADTVRVPVKAPDLGAGAEAELLIGGMVRTQPPKYRLTEKQRFDLLMTGEEPEAAFDADKLDVLPFFSAEMVPPENFARKYLANPGQVDRSHGQASVTAFTDSHIGRITHPPGIRGTSVLGESGPTSARWCSRSKTESPLHLSTRKCARQRRTGCF